MDKQELRRSMRGHSAVDPGVGFMVTSALFVWLSGHMAGTIAAFIAMRDEVDVGPLFERLPGWRWVLPRVESDRSLTFRDRDVPWETHRHGMQQPIDRGTVVPIHEIDMILVPGLAFDETGARLGRGAGYYDRVLASRRADCTAIGVTIESKVIGSVPMLDHDRRVDLLATESGVRECSPRS